MLSFIYMRFPANWHLGVGFNTCQMYYKHAPKTCRNFIELSRKGYYDGVIFHRIVKVLYISTFFCLFFIIFLFIINSMYAMSLDEKIVDNSTVIRHTVFDHYASAKLNENYKMLLEGLLDYLFLNIAQSIESLSIYCPLSLRS